MLWNDDSQIILLIFTLKKSTAIVGCFLMFFGLQYYFFLEILYCKISDFIEKLSLKIETKKTIKHLNFFNDFFFRILAKETLNNR